MKKFLLLLVFLLIGAVSVLAGTFTIAWDDPDNDPSKIDGYRLYQGSEPGVYDQVYDVGRSHIFVTPDLSDGTYYYAVAAYNANNEGPKSEEVSGIIQPVYVIKAPATLLVR